MITLIDGIFNAFFQVVPYALFEGAMGLAILFEFFYNFFEQWDML
jgi:hypothetical protein